MPLTPGYTEFECYESGKYAVTLEKPKAIKRKPFGGGQDVAKTEDAILWVGVADKLKRADGTPAEFMITTGTNYGSSNAALTRLVDGASGLKWTKEQALSMDMERLEGAKVFFLVTKEVGDDKKERNKVVEISRHKQSKVYTHADLSVSAGAAGKSDEPKDPFDGSHPADGDGDADDSY